VSYNLLLQTVTKRGVYIVLVKPNSFLIYSY